MVDKDILESFAELAEAYKNHFGIELDAESISDDETTVVVTDKDGARGVKRIGSVRSRWLKGAAPKYGFTRIGDTARFAFSGEPVVVKKPLIDTPDNPAPIPVVIEDESNEGLEEGYSEDNIPEEES